MIKIIEERPVPRDTAICLNCHSTLEYGNADLAEDYCWGNSNLAYSVPKHYFRCPVCGCKVEVSWIRRDE